MALYRMIGKIDAGGPGPLTGYTAPLIDSSTDVDYRVRSAIACLLNSGMLSIDGNFNRRQPTAIEMQYGNVVAAYMGNGVGWSVGEKILHGIAAVSMVAPRNAFLGLVGLNAFGYASKLQKAIAIPEGKASLEKIWYKLGGSFSALQGTINHGAQKHALLKISNGKFVAGKAAVNAAIGDGGAVTGPAAMIVAAATVVAAIMPVIIKILDKNGQNISYEGIDPATGQPYGTVQQSSPLDMLRNPVVIAAAAALAVYYLID